MRTFFTAVCVHTLVDLHFLFMRESHTPYIRVTVRVRRSETGVSDILHVLLKPTLTIGINGRGLVTSTHTEEREESMRRESRVGIYHFEIYYFVLGVGVSH